MKKQHRPTRAIFCAAALLSGAALPALGQDGGALVSLDMSTGLTYENDDTGSGTVWGTDVTGSVQSETANQRFLLSVGTRLEFGDTFSGENPDLSDPEATLEYAWFNRNTEASIGLEFAETDVGDGVLEDAFDAADLDDDGTRETHAATLQLVTGRAARFGTNTRLSYTELNFRDVTDPDLVDEVTLSASTELRFSINRQIELRASVSWSETEDLDATGQVQTEMRYGLAGDFLIHPALTAGLAINFADVETVTGAVTRLEDNFDIAATLTRDLPNGRATLEASYETDGGSEITTLEATRAMTLANGADLRASLGVIGFETGDVLPTFGLNYDREVLRGQTLSFALSQTGGRDNNTDETIFRTRIDSGYNFDLTPASSLSLNGSLASVMPQSGTDPDTLRASFGVSYRHDVTQDWALVARSDQRITYEDGTETDRDFTFSINLERSFSFRP